MANCTLLIDVYIDTSNLERNLAILSEIRYSHPTIQHSIYEYISLRKTHTSL